MIDSIQSYMRQGRHTLRKWALDPRVHTFGRAAASFFSGFGLSAASLGNYSQSFALGLVCACTGWSAVLTAMGASLGYLVFWGVMGYQGVLWVIAGLAAALLLGDRRITGDTPLLLPAVSALIVSAGGVVFQSWMNDTTPILIYLIRVVVGGASTALFVRVLRGRNPILDWIACGVATLALAQIVPIPFLGLGFIMAGVLSVTGAFPAVALAGLALDLARVTPVSMTAVACGSFLLRLWPRCPKGITGAGVGIVYILVMALCDQWDLTPLPALVLGSVAGSFLPAPRKTVHHRGETGTAQVRLEMAAGVFSQTEQMLLEVPEIPVDEDALVSRGAERACSGCPCRKNCKDAPRIAQLPGLILHKPLVSPEELPIVCRKSGRFLAELHRSQEQLRSIRADRERQREYRWAVIQQYRFLSEYLQDLSDQLARRVETGRQYYEPEIQVYGNRPEADNGDRCVFFAGTALRYYVLLCDGMGTGLGAVQEGRIAAAMLRRLLCAGFPADSALESLNSLCALRERAGAVTADLLELRLDSGKAVLYKWGAAPSYLLRDEGVEKIGVAGPPPGLAVTDCRQTCQRISLRRGELLVMVSDGVGEEEALNCCMKNPGHDPEALADAMLERGQLGGEDDATVVLVRLNLIT